MFAGKPDFFQALCHTVPVVEMGCRDSCHSHNGIHGGPDIMAHIRQELTLCPAGRHGIVQGTLKRLTLLFLLITLLIYTA